jgi:alkylation response protein AidB-like acyl-CoA dehydrogenase
VTATGVDAELLKRAEDFAERVAAPAADEIERTGAIPDRVWAELNDVGLLMMMAPRSFGGLETSMATSALVIEAVSRACLALGNTVAVSGTTLMPFVLGATPEQQERVLVPLAEKGGVACASMSERDAGSDLNAMSTTATRTGGGYLINGSKMWALHGGIADVFTIWAKAEAGITAFIVPRLAPGMTVGPNLERMGLAGVTVVEIELADVFVPDEDRLGAEGAGLMLGLRTINKGRLDVGAQCVGLARAAFDYAFDYAGRREQFGQPVIDFQAVQMRLADMSIRLEGADLMMRRAAGAIDDDDPAAVRYCAEVKVACSEMAVSVTSDALLTMGGQGYLKEHPVERLARDAVVYRLLDGTNDVNRLRIVAELRKAKRGL